jgi:hypothetical protein
MGYADVDRKAATNYEPPKFLKKLAEKNGADISKAKSEAEVRQIIEAAKKSGAAAAGKGEEPAKEGEVLPPLRYHDRHIVMPHINLNLPALNAHVEANVGPQWYDVAANVKDALLFMALGSFITVLIVKGLGL